MSDLKAIISPHAAYQYSGPTAAWAFASINPDLYSRIFVLGPSHKFYLENCGLTQMDAYATPLGPLPVDKKIINELSNSGLF